MKLIYKDVLSIRCASIALLLLYASTVPLRSQTSSASTPDTDAASGQAWCSLPPSSSEDFLRRQRQESTALKSRPERRQREREESGIEKLRGVESALEGGQKPTDAIIKGHLLHNGASGTITVPVTYEITRDGKEKIVTEFPSRTSTFLAQGSSAAMRTGTRDVPLSQASQEDHQILVLPQWSNLRHHSKAEYGVKSYSAIGGLDVIEILPAERSLSTVESLIPRTGTCIAIDPASQLVRRVEISIRAENKLTRVHRRSIVYSDYRRIDGIAVPFTQNRYLDGVLQDTLVVDNVTFNNGLSQSEFIWPSK